MAARPFPNMMEIPSRLTPVAWQTLRVGSIAGALALVAALIVSPDDGLFVLWKIVIPLLPLLFLVAPGLWRNLCPLAASNQTPRALKIGGTPTAPAWLRENGFLIAVTLFITFVCLRKVGLDDSGPASALLLLGAMSGAFTGGMLLKGKSGWCSSICPLLPVQRIYGQTPLLLVGNSHCRPCVGCTKNCYDFNPRVAMLADLADADRYWSGRRRLFVAAFPGLIYAFFHVPEVGGANSAGEVYGELALTVAASVALFFALEHVLPVSQHVLTSLFGAVAFSIFYWYGGPALYAAIADRPAPDAAEIALRAAAIALAATWFVRTVRKEAAFKAQAAGPAATATGLSIVGSRSIADRARSRIADPEVTFEPAGKRVVAKPKATLLELCEQNGVEIEAGCRMGVCGADPVAILEGMDNLSSVSDDERNTLERLGLGASCRMACQARVRRGPIVVSTDPNASPANAAPPSVVASFAYDKGVERVVVIGNGIAGVTAADHVRRRHPLAAIDVVADEPHPLYNRMGISRLIYGRSAMQGLHLNPDKWYSDRAITTWLNTRATAIDLDARRVSLGTGETLDFDRLVLANGSSAFVPELDGFGAPGTFVLRTATDALAVRAFAQQHEARRAIVAGGGLLGLEAAYALHKLGLRTAVLERSDRLLRRQLDERGAAILQAYLEGLGIGIIRRAEAASTASNGRLRAITLLDGRRLRAELLLVAAGITPNTDLARAAGVTVSRGVVVDDRMATSADGVYAAGDIAEHRGAILGLWPAAVEQAEVAAVNAVGGDRVYEGTVPVTALKVAGIDLLSMGRFEAEPADETIAFVSDDGQAYRKLVIEDGRVAGAILIGHPSDGPGVTAAVKGRRDVRADAERLRAGDWSCLAVD